MVLETWNERSSFSGETRSSDPIYGISDVFHNRYLVRERLPVDLAVLCAIVERLFGLAIMIARHRRLGSLHGVLLPRTWILVLWDDFLRYKDKRMAPLWYLVQATEKPLKDLYTGEYQRHAILDPRSRSEFSRVYYSHQVTLRSTARLPEQGTYLFQRYPTKIPTRFVCHTHVSVLTLEGLRVLMSVINQRCRCFCFCGCSQSISL